MCEQRELVLDYLYSEMPVSSRREMERHFQVCEDCHADVRSFRRVREDLLAWDVPQPASVWTPFAPAPVVPWFRQVPAWAMAAAAGLMFMIGAAGASAVVAFGDGGTATEAAMAATAPEVMTAGPALDAEAISSLIRQEVSSAATDLEGRLTPVATPVPVALKLDAATERRLMGQASQLIGASEQSQMGKVGALLYQVALDAERQRRDDGQRLGALQARLDELQGYVNQILVQQQTKVQ